LRLWLVSAKCAL